MKTKGKKKNIVLWILIFSVIIVLLAFDVRLKTVNYAIQSDKVATPVRIVLVSDLHSCKYGDGQKILIDSIEKQNPDVIVFPGDICDDIIPHENAEILIKAISNKYPCFYVTGNHEYWSGEVDQIKAMFRSYGVTVLEGTYETIEINGQSLNICGIDDQDVATYTDNENAFYSELEVLEHVSDNGYYTILLAHRPQDIETYLQYGFDLVLSGHAHGGQWRIPRILNGLYAPDQGLFPRYAGGRYDFENGDMIVSRGLARESTRVPRIFNRPELVIIDIDMKK